MPIDPRVTGSNTAESEGFLKAIEIRSITSFAGELKRSEPCRNILRRVKYCYGHERDICRQNSAAISQLASILGVSAATTAEKSGG
jgi:hypothetical protein